MTVVIDTWAILAYLQDEQAAADELAEMLGSATPVMSWVNLGEVYSVLCKHRSEADAQTVIGELRGVVTAELPSAERVLAAARLASGYPIAYAAAFAAATAIAHDATLWTGDPDLLIGNAPWACHNLRATT